jgi:hypothetical protein
MISSSLLVVMLARAAVLADKSFTIIVDLSGQGKTLPFFVGFCFSRTPGISKDEEQLPNQLHWYPSAP